MAESFFLCMYFLDYCYPRARRYPEPYIVLGQFAAESEDLMEQLRSQVDKEAARKSTSGFINNQVKRFTEDLFKKDEGRLMEFRIKAQQMDERLAESFANDIANDEVLHVAQYARNLAKELGIQITVVAQDEEDGPCGIYQWRYNGVVTTDKMQPRTWDLAKYLHERIGQKVAMTDLIGKDKVFDDSMTEDQSVAKQGRMATKWFLDSEIPLKVSSTTKSGSRTIWMEMVTSD